MTLELSTINQKMKVIAIAKGKKYPYALNQYNRGTVNNYKDVTAWFNEASVKLCQ